MDNLYELHFLLHGGIVFFIGLVAGFPYARSIVKTSNREGAWRLVHSASCMGGIWMMVLGLSLNVLEIPFPWTGAWLLISIISVYAFTVGMLIAAFSGSRGLDRKKDGVDKCIYIFYSIGAVTSIISSAFFLYAVITSF